MDINTLLLWFAGLGCLGMVARLLSLRVAQSAPFLIVCLAILAIGGLAFYRWPQQAGFVSAALWFAFVLLPLWAQQGVHRCLARRRFGLARKLARAAVVLHPFGTFRELPSYATTLERLARGERLAVATTAPVSSATPLERYLYAQALRSECRFAELAAFTRALPAEVLRKEGAFAVLHARALAELGELEAMLLACAEFERVPALAGARDAWRLLSCARLGRVELVRTLLSGPFGRTQSQENNRFWLATAHQAAAEPEAAAELLRGLVDGTALDVQQAARLRLEQPLPPADPHVLSPAAQKALDDIACEIEASTGVTTRLRSAATLGLVASLALVFILELPGGTTDAANLLRLGALLIPPEPPWDGPWRVAAAAWLHFGAAHFAMNALGLWILGRRVEAMIGSGRMVALYTASALGGNLAARALLAGPAILAGASGGVMGLLGALLAIGLRRQRSSRSRFMRQHVAGILIAVLLQVLFDLSTPQISSTAHIAGFVVGYLLALTLYKPAR